MNKPTKVIINADDLGASLKVNNAIFDLMSRRLISSATMMANGSAIDDAISKCKDYPYCSFGIHLNLTQFRPLIYDKRLAPLLNVAGYYQRDSVRTVSLIPDLRNAIFAELSAQIESLKSKGVSISHIDSHHHIHTIPKLFGVVKALQSRFGINKIRLSMNVYRNSKSSIFMLKKELWNNSIRYYYKTSTTDYFTSLNDFAYIANNLVKNPRSIELMVHPGSIHNELELNILKQGLETLCPFELRLINYNQL